MTMDTTRSLWEEAFEDLSGKDKDELCFARKEENNLSAVIKAVTDKREECVKKQFTLYINNKGEKVLVRDVMNKVCGWIEKFKEVGDIAFQFDPSHATIPWIAVKAILQMTINDCQTFGSMLDSIETILSIVARYTELETRVLIRTSAFTKQLTVAIIKLYTSALQFLAQAHRYYGKNTFKRVLESAVNSVKSVIEEPMIQIEKYEDDIYKLVCLVQNECMGIRLEDIIASIKQSLDNSHTSREERRKQLSPWINGINTKNTYETALQYHHKGTCEWVFKLREFQDWQSEGSEISQGRLLWIHGPAGFGKTFISAWIIRYLQEKENQQPLSYFFCVADNQPTRDPYSILRSWLTQILEQNEAALPLMESVFAARSKEQTLTHLGLWELFVAVGEFIPGCTFIVDGFDECIDIDAGAHYHKNDPRNYFLRDMLKYLPKTKSRILIVSRDVPDIREFLGKNSEDGGAIGKFEYGITVKDTTADVKSFSEFVVNNKLPKKNSSLRQTIADQATERSEGMFLWIKLLEKEISPGQNAKQLTATVNGMPSGISEAYSRELDKIAQLSTGDKDQAVMILKWVLYAVRPLQVKELAEALVVSDNDLDQYPADDLPDTWEDGFVDDDYVKEMILGRCGSLLQLRSSSANTPLADHTVHFVHFSVKEYLSSLSYLSTADHNQLASALGLANGAAEEIRLSNTCLHYLTLDVFTEMPLNTDMYPFLSYAAWAWYFHSFHKKPTPPQNILEQTQKVFDPTTSSWKVWTPLMEVELNDADRGEWDFGTLSDTSSESNSSPDEATSYPSMTTPQEVSDRSTMVENPIYYASLLGLTDVVRWLEEKGLDCACKGGRYGFPLQAAVARNHEDVVRHLLNRKIDVSQRGGEYGAAIIAAAALSTPEILEILLTAGADVTAVDEAGWTALLHASKRGSTQILSRLVEYGADLDATAHSSGGGWTAASLACALGHKEILAILLDKGSDISKVEEGCSPPLQLAILARHEDLVTMILDRGCRINQAFPDGSLPLHSAAMARSLRTVKRLLEMKANPNQVNKENSTALQIAVGVTDVEIVRALIDAGADLSYSHPEMASPIQLAAIQNCPSIIRLLHAHGADLDEKMNGSVNALMLATSGHNCEAVETLLDLGASMQCMLEYTLQSLFDMADILHDQEIAILLVRRGCFQMRTDTTKQQARDKKDMSLAVSAYYGDVEDVKKFLEQHRDTLTAADHSEALNAASARGHESVVRFLLNNNSAPINAKDVNGRTALHHAARRIHQEVADLLVERGASISIEDDVGSTPIDLAVLNGKEALGFIQKHMNDLTLTIVRRPSLLQATDGEQRRTKLTSSELRKAISGSWNGHYEMVSWKKGRVKPFSIVIPPSGTDGRGMFSDENSDEVGSFYIHGFVDQVGTVWFIKLYQSHGWLYRGKLDLAKSSMKGTWGSNRKLWFGTFELVLE